MVFGRGDSFLNLFADLARMFPVLPLAGATARFQPVYVEDVAEAVWQSLTRDDAGGQTFQLAGPTVHIAAPARRVRLRARGQAAPDLSAVREAGDVAGAPHGARPQP